MNIHNAAPSASSKRAMPRWLCAKSNALFRLEMCSPGFRASNSTRSGLANNNAMLKSHEIKLKYILRQDSPLRVNERVEGEAVAPAVGEVGDAHVRVPEMFRAAKLVGR